MNRFLLVFLKQKRFGNVKQKSKIFVWHFRKKLVFGSKNWFRVQNCPPPILSSNAKNSGLGPKTLVWVIGINRKYYEIIGNKRGQLETRTIRNELTVKITSLLLRGHFWDKFWDSRHSEQSKCTVFDEESEFHVKNKRFLEPGGKT